MQNYFEAPKPKLIYVFRILDKAHEGCLKVGETTLEVDDTINPFTIQPNSSTLNKCARKRIDQYTQTAGISYELLYTECTLHMKGMKIGWFQDKDVHEVLRRSGIKRKEFENIGKQGREWFVTDLETVKKAIVAVKEGRKALSASEITQDLTPIEFRPEQRKAIDVTKKRYLRYPVMLWNAKMRFGKTWTALQVIKEMEFGKTLIYTHRPDVIEDWFNGFKRVFFDRDDYQFGSKVGIGSDLPTLERHHKKESLKYVFFASLQDLRGSKIIGGKFEKNDDVFSTDWDFIIIDEAHEGTQTALGKAVFSELTKSAPKRLELTGTAFNLLDNFVEEEVFTWDYTMEQRAKEEWDRNHFGDPNPYAGLPRMNIYTYDLGRLLHNEQFNDEDIAFNFREFFRTTEDGTFVHEADVMRFLDLLTKEDPESMYPFANQRYRNIFRHTLWMLPGVAAAKALSTMLRNHPVFSKFDVVNVAGDGDEEEEREKAYPKVKKAIQECQYGTITLSCGRMTTGVSVPQWMGVLMLSGSFNTAASAYMQTIFRVQTPYTRDGLVKEDCYVFDFAPDRTLQVLATVPRVSTKAGKTTEAQKRALSDFLNFCPVIGMEGSKMKSYDANKMMEQLKKAYVERVVRNGFEDGYLYNDELLKLDGVALEEFQKLKKIIGTTKAMAKTSDIDINIQGLTKEEYEEKEKLEKRKKKELTDEERKRLVELKERRKTRDTAVSILRGISIRMPLLIYGADITDEETQLTIDNFTELVDDQSWEEFMPKGVTKEIFNNFKKYYDDDVFASAGKRIRAMARAADRLTIEERIERITGIFNTFRNPDKETVLTPWRVVNMHMSDTLGGYTFYDKDFKETLREPRYVEHHKVTDEVFAPGSHLLEINSKSGLYPLYLAYNLYRRAVKEEMASPQKLEEHLRIWDRVVAESIFVICKTPMAKAITRRTLMGFRKGPVNTRYFEDLINQIKNKPDNFLSKVPRGKTFWKANDNDDMKFNAIVGNPPYQEMDGGGTGSSAIPLYNLFVDASKRALPDVMTMIMPAKWYSGGRGLDTFREEMLNDRRISKLVDFQDSKDCFPTVDIAGGICYFLWQNYYNGECLVVNKHGHKISQSKRYLNTFDTFIRNDKIIKIIQRIQSQTHSFVDRKVYARKPFGLRSFDKGFPAQPGRKISLFGSDGISYLSESEVPQNAHLIPKWKVIMSKASAEHAGQTDKEGRKRIVSRLEILPPGAICTESYLLLDVFESETEAVNMKSYMRTQFVRFLLGAILLTQNIVRDKFRFVPDQDFTEKSDIDWSQSVADIDRQLYKKYDLSDDEVAFIESMIKPMA